MLTCPYPPSGGQLLLLEATKSLRAADNGENDYKNNMHKYKNLAPAGGYGFKSSIIETSDTHGRSLEKHLERNIEKAAETWKIPKTILWRYWILAYSVVYQRPAAGAILRNIYRNREKINDIEVNRETIMDFDFKDINEV